jgi:hypothetical protein
LKYPKQSLLTESRADKDKNIYPQFMPKNNEVNLKDSTEIGEALRELNNDDLDLDTRMSGIDMRSRLHYMEVAGILQFDTLIMFHFLPRSALPFTRQKKRLAVSLNGLGRTEIKDIVAGKIEKDTRMAGSSIGDKLKNMFSPQQQQ